MAHKTSTRQQGRVTTTPAEIKRFTTRSSAQGNIQQLLTRYVQHCVVADFVLESSGPRTGLYRLDITHNKGYEWVIYELYNRSTNEHVMPSEIHAGEMTLELWFDNNTHNITCVVI